MLAFLGPRDVRAQDAQVWGHAYGLRAQLLGGVTVGSVLDLSSNFYNPGATALTSESNLVLGGASVIWSRLEVDTEDDRKNVSSDRVTSVPNIFALKLQDSLRHGRALSFAYLTRFDVKYELRAVAAEGAVDTAGAALAGETLLLRKLGETWVGVGWSRAYGRFGVGANLFAAHRTETIRGDFVAQSARADTVRSLTTTSDARFYHTRVLAKVGAVYQDERRSAGIAVTLPGFKVLGSGKTFANAAAVNVDFDGDGLPDDLLASSVAEDLAVTYRAPWSVAAGGSYDFRPIRVHAAAEWVSGVAEYAVMKPESLDVLSGSTSIPLSYRRASRTVLNFGLGIEWRLGDRTGLFAAARTDYSTLTQVSGSLVNSISSWDIGHVGAGAAFRIATLDLTAGVEYGFGAGPLFDVNRLPTQDDQTASALLAQSPDIRYRALSGVIGFGLPF